MSSTALVNLDALPPEVRSILPPLEHLESNDCFQQMLITDSALEALTIARSNLVFKYKPQALFDEQPLTAQAAAADDVFLQSLADLDLLLKTFEDLQATARHRFELHARSRRQIKTGIMDLPVEMLLSIFEVIRPPLDFRMMLPNQGSEEADGVETIKNIRLTCRRFRQNSSHLLIQRLNISPNQMSIDRLEKVSSHPQLSRGERILSIDLGFYTSKVAGSFRHFSRMWCQSLQNDISTFRISAIDERLRAERSIRRQEREEEDQGKEEGSNPLPEDISIESAKNAVAELQSVLSIWEKSLVEKSARRHLAGKTLVRGYKRYVALYRQQQKVLQDGSFARAVAAAAAASKSRVWLTMSDEARGPSPDHSVTKLGLPRAAELAKSKFMFFTDPHRRKDAVSYLARPHQWLLAAEDRDFQVPASYRDLPQSLLYEIPLALHATGAQLAGFEVNIYYRPHMLDLEMSDDQLSGLAEVTRDLETFTFCAKPFFNKNIPFDLLVERPKLYAYLRAAMGSQRLSNLCLDLTTDSDRPNRIQFDLEPLICSLNWHGLKSVMLGNFGIDLEDLIKLLDMLQPGIRLCLRDIYLTSGTWAEALDCLRAKVNRDSELTAPSGAECDGMREAYSEIFGSLDEEADGVEDSLATQYIRSVEGVENPLRRNDEST